jgi:hypothetical protein
MGLVTLVHDLMQTSAAVRLAQQHRLDPSFASGQILMHLGKIYKPHVGSVYGLMMMINHAVRRVSSLDKQLASAGSRAMSGSAATSKRGHRKP